MKSRGLIRITCLLMAAGSLFAQNWNSEAEASRLLKEVQSSATLLSRDATALHSYARNSLSRESHMIQVSLVKDHINAIGKRLDRLQAIRLETAPWQQQAIDSVAPAAANLAAHTGAAIQHLNERKPLWDPDYSDRLRAISDRSGEVKEAIDLHLEMASTQDRLEQLRERQEKAKGDNHV